MVINSNKKSYVLAISGPIGVGKTSLCSKIQQLTPAEIIRTRDLISNHTHTIEPTREAFQRAGDQLDDDTDHSWINEAICKLISKSEKPDRYFVLDSVRTLRQLFWLRTSKMFQFAHVHLIASPSCLRTRFEARNDMLDEKADYNIIKKNRHESEIAKLETDAKLVVNTEENSPSELAKCIIKNVWPHLELNAN